MSVPNNFVLRTGRSNWRLFIPLLVADTTTNYMWWNPDSQYNNIDVAPDNEVAIQFSYFAAYWLNRNKAAIGTEFSVPVYGSGGTFYFKATSTNPVSSYQGKYPPVNGSYIDLPVQQDGIDAGYNAVNGAWNILMKTHGPKPSTSSMGNFQGLLANSAFKTMTVSTANSRKSFGDDPGFYEGFFTTNKITRLALVDGTSTSLTDLTGNTNYIIYDLVESSGSETIFQILNRLDTYAANNNMAGSDAPTFRSPSVVNYTAGINGYSGTWSARSSATAFNSSTFPDKICVCGINIDADDDIQFLAAYWGDLNSGKGDSWRLLAPSQTLWSLWGNDWHTDTTASSGRRVSTTNGIQTSPGINASVSTYTGDVYLLAFSYGIITLTLGNFDMTRTFGSGSFNITQPASDSSGAFTYSVKSGTGVISISGNTITILSAGTATVTASQAASGNYTSATKDATITINRATSTLTASQNTFYRKFVSGATISFDSNNNISSNAGTVSRTYASNDTAIVTIPSSGTASATIAGSGKVTIRVTQPATTNYTEVISDLITIVVIGQGKTYSSESFPSSFDLTGTDLTGTIFTSCTFTETNLFGITINSSTNFSNSTLTRIKSGRIIGKTSLLPAGFTMI